MFTKKQMTEEDIKLRYITAVIVAIRKLNQITTETEITDSKVNLKGDLAVCNKFQESTIMF